MEVYSSGTPVVNTFLVTDFKTPTKRLSRSPEQPYKLINENDSANLNALALNKLRNLVRLHTQSDCELGIHTALSVSEDLLVLLVQALTLILEHLSSLSDSAYKTNDISSVSTGKQSVESFLTRIPVLDPLDGILIDTVDELQCFLLGDDGLDLGRKLLVIARNIYDLSLVNKERLQDIVLLGTLMVKTNVFDIIDLADTAAAVNYSFSLRKAHIPPLS